MENRARTRDATESPIVVHPSPSRCRRHAVSMNPSQVILRPEHDGELLSAQSHPAAQSVGAQWADLGAGIDEVAYVYVTTTYQTQIALPAGIPTRYGHWLRP